MLRKQPYFIVVVLLFVSVYTKSSFAQDYKGSVGGRFGFGIGLSGTYYLYNGHALEFMLRYGYHGLILNKPGAHIQALYQKHWELGRSNFTAYLGAGPGIGFGKRTSLSPTVYFAMGLSPQVGFDYTAQRIKLPLIVSLDYKPAFHVDFPINKKSTKILTDFSYYEIALSVKFGLSGKRGKRRY